MSNRDRELRRPDPVAGGYRDDRDRNRDRDRDRDRDNRGRIDRIKDESIDRPRDRDRDRDRTRDIFDRDRQPHSHSHRDEKARDISPIVDRDRDRDRDRGVDRDRYRPRDDRDYDRPRVSVRDRSSPVRDRSRSRSRSRSPSYDSRRDYRRQNKPTGWDKLPTPEQLYSAEQAATVNRYSSVSASAPAAAAGIDPRNRYLTRLYVGNFPDCFESELRSFILSQFKSTFPTADPGDPIVSLHFNAPKHFAFIEFRSFEESSSVLAVMDGLSFKSQLLKIKRPSDYIAPSNANTVKLLPTAAQLAATGEYDNIHNNNSSRSVPSLSSPTNNSNNYNNNPNNSSIPNNVPDGPYKIFLGGIPYSMSEEDLKDLLQLFGPLESFNLVFDRSRGISKGFGFCLYKDVNVTDTVIRALNNLQLGEKRLTVRCGSMRGPADNRPPPNIGSAAQPLSNSQIKAINALQAQFGTPPSLTANTTALITPNNNNPVLILSNILNPSDLINQKFYEEVYSDIRTELGQYGKILSLYIPRPNINTDSEELISNLGDVLIEFATPSDATTARTQVEGREFAGRIVKCNYLSIEQYDSIRRQ